MAKKKEDYLDEVEGLTKEVKKVVRRVQMFAFIRDLKIIGDSIWKLMVIAFPVALIFGAIVALVQFLFMLSYTFMIGILY